jgi:hypothetical protein
MLIVLSGTLVVIKLAANCYKNYFPSPYFLQQTFSVAFFGWIKNDVMVKEKIVKILCAFLSTPILSLLLRRRVR